MSSDDPFSGIEPDRTIIKPNPGARARPHETPHAADSDERPEFASLFRRGGADNPLIDAGSPLLRLAPVIRGLAVCHDPAALRDTLIRGVREFESQTLKAGVPVKQIAAARYILCTSLDEAASATPWGAEIWAPHSLLVTICKETWGGDTVFRLLARLMEEPASHLHLLELMNVVLALGFEGRYRLAQSGRNTLDAIRNRLHALILAQRGEPEAALSPHWKGHAVARPRVADVLPIWLIGAFALLLLMLVFVGLRVRLGVQSDPAFTTLASLEPGAAPPAVITTVAKPRLAQLLAPDIRDGRLTVSDQVDRSLVTLRGDSVFVPGSADIDPHARPLIQRIASALNAVPGNVLITGHTDSQPMHTGRFPSNWELSQQRADNVRALLAQNMPSARLKAEGKGDAEPIAPNDTPAGRARNRRVDITLIPASGT